MENPPTIRCYLGKDDQGEGKLHYKKVDPPERRFRPLPSKKKGKKSQMEKEVVNFAKDLVLEKDR